MAFLLCRARYLRIKKLIFLKIFSSYPQRFFGFPHILLPIIAYLHCLLDEHHERQDTVSPLR